MQSKLALGSARSTRRTCLATALLAYSASGELIMGLAITNDNATTIKAIAAMLLWTNIHVSSSLINDVSASVIIANEVMVKKILSIQARMFSEELCFIGRDYFSIYISNTDLDSSSKSGYRSKFQIISPKTDSDWHRMAV